MNLIEEIHQLLSRVEGLVHNHFRGSVPTEAAGALQTIRNAVGPADQTPVETARTLDQIVTDQLPASEPEPEIPAQSGGLAADDKSE